MFLLGEGQSPALTPHAQVLGLGGDPVRQDDDLVLGLEEGRSSNLEF